MMVSFSDEQRSAYAFERICRVLPIALLSYKEKKGREADPQRSPKRLGRYRELPIEIARVWKAN